MTEIELLTEIVQALKTISIALIFIASAQMARMFIAAIKN